MGGSGCRRLKPVAIDQAPRWGCGHARFSGGQPGKSGLFVDNRSDLLIWNSDSQDVPWAFVLAFQAEWRRIEIHNVVIRKC